MSRRTGCIGKIKYNNIEHAKSAMAQTIIHAAKINQPIVSLMNVYKCDFCHKYHIGKQKSNINWDLLDKFSDVKSNKVKVINDYFKEARLLREENKRLEEERIEKEKNFKIDEKKRLVDEARLLRENLDKEKSLKLKEERRIKHEIILAKHKLEKQKRLKNKEGLIKNIQQQIDALYRRIEVQFKRLDRDINPIYESKIENEKKEIAMLVEKYTNKIEELKFKLKEIK